MTSLSDQEVLQNISNGLALKGILLENDCYSSGREPVLNVPSLITLKPPILQKSIQQNEFHSKKLRNAFIKSLQNGEYSFTQSYDRLTDKLDLGTESYWNKHYFGVVRYRFVPVSSFTFDIDTIALTDRCINILSNLEEKFQILSDDDMQKLCDHFFRTFGSHINVGPVHFGGIFLWTSDYHSITKYDGKLIQQVSERTLDSFNGPSAKISVPELTERISLEVSHIGGMDDVSSDNWERNMTIERTKWSLIDRGSEKNFVRIWNLLKNHRQSFRNLAEFRIHLDNAWEKHKENKLLLDIRGYCNDNVFVKNCKIYLQIISNAKMDPDRITQWNDIILEPAIVNLLMTIFRNREDLDTGDVYDVKTLLFELLGGTEDISFDGKEDLLRWINPNASLSNNKTKLIYSIPSFLDEIIRFLVPKLKEAENLSEEEKITTEIECQHDFSLLLKRALTILLNHKRFNDASFLKLILFELGYNLESDMLQNCERLTLSSIQYLIDHFYFEYRRYEKLKKTDTETINFYLLGIALKAAEKRNLDQTLTESKFKSLLSHINLEAGSRGVIESYTKELLSWEKIRYIINKFNISNKRILKEDGGEDNGSVKDHAQSLKTQNKVCKTVDDKVEGPFEAVSRCQSMPEKQMQSISHVPHPTIATVTNIDQMWNEAINLPPPEIKIEAYDDDDCTLNDVDECTLNDVDNISIGEMEFEENMSAGEIQLETDVVKSDENEQISSLSECPTESKTHSKNISLMSESSTFKDTYEKQIDTWGKLTSALEASIDADSSPNEKKDVGIFDVCDDLYTDRSEVSNVNNKTQSLGNTTENEARKVNLNNKKSSCTTLDGTLSDCNVHELVDEETSWCMNKAYQDTNTDEVDVRTIEQARDGENCKENESTDNECTMDSLRDQTEGTEVSFNAKKYKNRFGNDCIYLPEPNKPVEKRNSFTQERGSSKNQRFAYRKSKLRKTKSATDLCYPDYLLDNYTTPADADPPDFDNPRSCSSPTHDRPKIGKVSKFTKMFEKWTSVPNLNDSFAILQPIHRTSSAYSDFIEIEKNYVARRRRELALSPVFNKLKEKRCAFAQAVSWKAAFAASTPDLTSSIPYHESIQCNSDDKSDENVKSSVESPVFDKLKEKRSAFAQVVSGKAAVTFSTSDLTNSLQLHDNIQCNSEDKTEENVKNSVKSKDIIVNCNTPLMSDDHSNGIINSNNGGGQRNVDGIMKEIKLLRKRCNEKYQNFCNENQAESYKVDGDDLSQKEKTSNDMSLHHPEKPLEQSRNRKIMNPINSNRYSDEDTTKTVNEYTEKTDCNCQSPSVRLTEEVKKVTINIDTKVSDGIEKEPISPANLESTDKNGIERRNTYTIEDSTKALSQKPFDQSIITGTQNDITISHVSKKEKKSSYDNIERTLLSDDPIVERKYSKESSSREKFNIVDSSERPSEPRRTPSLDLHSNMTDSKIRLSIESRGCEKPESLDIEIKAEETYTSKIQILDRLGLISYFPSKITLTDVRRCFKNTVDDLYDVPWFFLSKILMLDYNGRNMLQFPLHSNRNSNKSIDNDLDTLFEISALTERAINPMDVVVSVILCSDYFLRQLLAQKLYMCRLSIPLLLPKLSDEYELQIWPLRGISLGAECENDSALTYTTPIITFLRFGDLPQSKSKLINDLLSDQSTDTFFHKDCGNGSEKKVLSYGLIDAAWYIPSPTMKCICRITDGCKCHINQLVMFLNLHGNAKDLDTPCKFICKVSNIVTVLIDVRKLKNKTILDCFKKTVDDSRSVLLILTNEKFLSIENFRENYANLLHVLGRNKERVKPLLTFNQFSKPINLQKLKEMIKSSINQLLSEKYMVAKSLSDQFKYLYVPKIKVDEEDKISKSAHTEAYTIFAMMNNEDLVKIKERFLPLQGDLWEQWGELERDMKRGQPNSNQSFEHYVSNVHMQQMVIRDQQVLKFRESNRVMQMICGSLKRLKGNSRRFYIHWLRYYLDELARKQLPQIRLKLQNKWSDLTALQQNGLETNYKKEYELLKTDIRELEKSLEKASLGLEHIFREVGQIYESFSISSKADVVTKRRFETLPLVMAELMLQGYTVEIMDGNARQVPMTFIKAVFNQLDKLIKGNVFVLSVLGLQSSGKSTLLNAMFGVQFSTSAGRCTQGVNAQLVSMPENIKERYSYEYIMLIDTEGLRSADLGDGNRQRDNELATLAVGLGDLSIINVKGENQTELNDVLQIVVHALLKIKMVNKRLRLQSSCFFVHQNVGAIDAEAKLLDEQMKLAHKLDAIAVAAAAQTGHHDITSFSKIIEFDVQRDIRYFCDLWQGNPPMAPTNPGYSKKVRDVKTTLLETIIPRKDTKTNMATLTSRLEDLWSGILDEDFVFSFKNSQEIKAYTTLETEYNNIKWELKEKGLIWLNDIKLNMKGSSSNEFSINEYHIEIDEMMENAYEDFAKSLATFCKKSNERTILEQWRANYQLKLKVLKDETVSEIIKMLKDDIQIRKRQLENDKRSIAWREAFRTKAIDLAKSESSSDVKLSSKQMKTVFEGLWEESLKELPSCTFDGEDNIELIVTNYLKTAARPNHQVFQHYYDCMKAGTLDTTTYFQPMEKYIMKCDGFVKQIWRSLFNEYTEKVDEITQRIFKKVNNYAANIKQKNFSKAHVEKVVEIVTKEIEEWNQSGRMFELTAWYKVEILVKVGEQIKPSFITLQENFKKKVDPRSQLESFKLLLLTQFMDTFEQIKQEKTIAKLVSQVVENAIVEKMNIDIPRDLANDVRTTNAFMLSKKELLTKVLTDLADEDEFLEFMKFVDNTNEFLRGRLRRYTNEYLFSGTDKKFSSLAITRCESIFANVAKNLQSMRNVLEQPNVDPNIEEWIESFTIAMKNTIPVTKDVMKDMIKDSVKGEFDIKIYDEFLMERFNKLKENLREMYRNITTLDESIEQQVVEQLAGSVLGCGKQCPFCRVSCTLTVNDHDVDCSSPQHYPKGVAGYHWTMNKKLAIDTCTTAVASDLTFRNIDTKYKSVPFKDYKNFYTTWKIQGDKSLDASLYWKWFMAKYIDELAEYYKHEVPDIPEAWHVSKEAAQRSLVTQI